MKCQLPQQLKCNAADFALNEIGAALFLVRRKTSK